MNVLYINSDNMRYDQFQYMPQVRAKIRARGTTYTQARVNVALCNPSRVGSFLGQWCSHSGYNNQGSSQGSLIGLDLNNQWAKWLYDAGVRCGMFGKPYNADGTYHPKPTGWATWCHTVLTNQTTYDLGFQIDDGTTSTYPSVHLHDYFLQELETFIAGSEPWFAYFAPHSPHAPYNGNLNNLFAFSQVKKNPVFMTDTSAAPSWIGASPGLTLESVPLIQSDYRRQVRELAVLDDMIGQLMDSVDLSDTIVMFTSDNGAYYGEHRSTVFQYNDLYDGCLRVACAVAGPGFAVGVESDAMVSIGADFTATTLAVLEADAVHGALSGIDLTKPIDPLRSVLHDCNSNIGPVGLHNYNGVAITTSKSDPLGHMKMIRWETTDNDKYEMYDLVADPEELSNQANLGGAYLTKRDALEVKLNALIAGST